jgi:hypothetical protein
VKYTASRWTGALLLALLIWSPTLTTAGESLKPEELVSHHLDSLGSANARAAKTRVFQGTATYRLLVGGGGQTDGKSGLVSEGKKVRFMAKFPLRDYHGETAVFDGNSVHVAFSNSNQSRSPFASFLATYDVILREGLLGSVLSTAWPLAELSERKPKLVYEGVKKLDGQPVHQLRYFPHKGNDLQIVLFFDTETFRHVKTIYSYEVGNNVGATILESAHLKPERSSLEERFSDFKEVDGLTLPTHWNLHFTRELPDGSTSISEWDLRGTDISNNMGLDPRNFEVK